MIRHIALFRFDPGLPANETDRLVAGFEALVDQVDGFIGVSGGINVSPEQLDQGFRHGIVADFEDMGALKAYLQHPAHIGHAARVLAALKTGVEHDVIVFDLEL